MNTAVQIQPKSVRPALRLVKTNTLSRDEWLEVRKHGIGSSDAAAALGLNPYKSQLELWMEKTGRDTDLPKPDPTDTTAPVYWGTLLENPSWLRPTRSRRVAGYARSMRCYSTLTDLGCSPISTGK